MLYNDDIRRIISEELSEAEKRIYTRLSLEEAIKVMKDDDNAIAKVKNSAKELPKNENYEKALDMYKKGGTHSAVARELKVSILTAKRYYNWLVINGFLTSEKEELSPKEKEIVGLLYEKKMSLRNAADKLGCSVSNVVYFRNNALRKGYKPKK